MEWSEILADRALHDLPYKIETNAYGQIVMSPASNEHGYLQAEIAAELRSHGSGRAITESSIDTPLGVKVADVVWCSQAFVEEHMGENPFSAAPELCVEVSSPSNTRAELSEKRSLYFGRGASEVWECDLNGRVVFYDPSGEIADSTLFPGFPIQIG